MSATESNRSAAVLYRSVALDDRVTDLFQPLSVRSLTVRNRLATAPMPRRGSPDGIPGADVAKYYARRAAGGVGLIITEGIRLAQPEAGWPASIPTIAGDDVLAGWRAVTAAVHSHGGAIAAQLWHQGAERGDADGIAPVSPSGINSAGEPRGRALRTDELAVVADSFAQAARN